jgi:hypothetical protein
MTTLHMVLGPIVAVVAAFGLGWVCRGLREERRLERPWGRPDRRKRLV